MTRCNSTMTARPNPAGILEPVRKSRLLSFAALFALCLPLQGCFTTGLWSSDLNGREKAYLTVVSLTLDVVTLPLQLAVLDSANHHHHHHCR